MINKAAMNPGCKVEVGRHRTQFCIKLAGVRDGSGVSEEKEPRQFNGWLPQWFLAYFVYSVVSVRSAFVPEPGSSEDRERGYMEKTVVETAPRAEVPLAGLSCPANAAGTTSPPSLWQ